MPTGCTPPPCWTGTANRSRPSDPLTGFAIAGADRKYVNADAVIQGDTVVVSSPAVPQPTAVRYGWANYPLVNLYNSAGLPASPFQTDPFPARKGEMILPAREGEHDQRVRRQDRVEAGCSYIRQGERLRLDVVRVVPAVAGLRVGGGQDRGGRACRGEAGQGQVDRAGGRSGGG